MNETKTYPLSLNGDTFNSLKSDFEQMLRQLLTEMEKRDSEDATMTIKLAVELKKDQARDYLCNGYDGTRDITKPSFKHEINTVMQVKNKKTGTLGGNYELVWDKELMQYVMREIDNGQISMFDKGKSSSTADSYAEDQQVIEGVSTERPALPSPDGYIDADYEVVAEHDSEDVVNQVESDEDVSTERPDDTLARMKYLLPYVGAALKVCVAAGYYTVRDENNKVVLSSAFAKDDAFFCTAEVLAPHVGHNITCIGSPSDEEQFETITIWCDECDEKLFEMSAPPREENEPDDYQYTTP